MIRGSHAPSRAGDRALAITNFRSFFTTARIESWVAEAADLPLRKSFDTILGVSPSTAAVASSPKLLDRVRWHLRVKHYSIRTEQAYVDWIRRYILFHRKRHPNEMSEKEIAEFLTHLAVEKSVAASTQNQAFSALLFLYQQVLERKLDFIENVQRVSRPAKIPVVFTRAEAHAVLKRLHGENQLMAELLYGAGLRLMECVRLRVKDIDFGYNQITVRDGKGQRQRLTLLPQRLRRPLHLHLTHVRALHQRDLANGSGKVHLPFALERKYPNANKSWPWQYVFPAAKLSIDPRSGETRRHHIPHSFPPPSVTFLYFHAGGYSFGTPNPEYYRQGKGDEAAGVGTAAIEAYADPAQRYVCIAFAAGNQYYSDGTLFSTVPMPEIANTVFPMDAISASASLFQVSDIAGLFSKKMKRRLTISATIQCPVGFTDSFQTDGIGGLFALYPGLVTSQLSGLVAAIGTFRVA